jgi:PAS domain S-box-containing protein
MEADNALIFLLDEKSGELVMAAHRGASEEFVRGVDRLKMGEGFNGRVAASGEPLYIEDASKDSRLTREVVSRDGVRSVLIVPLTSKSTVNGTICVNMLRLRKFQPEEIELLVAIGNQIGVAVDNAHLYQQQQRVAEDLKVSEERYRELFENAHDAIWLQDLTGKVLAVNQACEALTGYSRPELQEMNVISFLPDESLELSRRVRNALLRRGTVDQPYEQRLTRRDGSEAVVQLSTSLVYTDGKPSGFQHIARDITEQKALQENMQFYVQQATRAQEEERRRISRELHDDTIQALVVLSRQLDALATRPEGLGEEVRHRLEELWQQSNNIMQGVRRLSQDLRPASLDRLGLLPALEWLAQDVDRYSGLKTEVKVSGPQRRFSEEVELVLFRIVQEALRNVWRHSEATAADITVAFGDGKTEVTVTDNGRGFSLPESVGDLAKVGKLGLAGMHERAKLVGGTLSVQSRPGGGSSVTVEIPL